MSTSSISGDQFQMVEMPVTYPSQDDNTAAPEETRLPAASAYISMNELSDMKSRDSYSQSVHTDVRRDEPDTVPRNLGKSSSLDIFEYTNESISQSAHLVLIRMKYAAHAARYAPAKQNAPVVFLTQLIIDCHVAVIVEMMRLKQIDPCPRDIIAYVCGTFEQPGVSSMAGQVFRGMKYSDRVMAVLAVARAVVAPIWIDYEDAVYAECHRQMDAQALFYVRTTYHRRSGGCCVTM